MAVTFSETNSSVDATGTILTLAVDFGAAVGTVSADEALITAVLIENGNAFERTFTAVAAGTPSNVSGNIDGHVGAVFNV